MNLKKPLQIDNHKTDILPDHRLLLFADWYKGCNKYKMHRRAFLYRSSTFGSTDERLEMLINVLVNPINSG